MILGNVATVLHGAPARPGAGGVLGWAPDLLAPDDILEVDAVAVVHDPFSHVDTGESGLL